MPVSSLFLRSSSTFLSLLYLLSTPVSASFGPPSTSTAYSLDTEYSGDNFYSGFDFWTEADPTHGFVTYLDQQSAQAAGLLRRGAKGSHVLGVDSTNTYNPNVTYYGVNGVGRPSVRLSTTKTWNHGLFIADLANMPGGECGIWPAFWTLGDGTWPYHGEIDIIEGVNDMATDLTSLHTGGACSVAGGNETGVLQSTNCTYDVATGSNGAGCGVSETDTKSYGRDFNSNGGGVYAMEWTDQAIKIWFFQRSSIPADIIAGTPYPSGWGLPNSNFQGSCDIDDNFQNHQVIIDATFCGDWAGAVWGNSCAASTGYSSCAAYVAGNPGKFQDMYWDINSIKVYTSASASTLTSSSSTSTSITTHSSTITSMAASSLTSHSSCTSTFANTSSVTSTISSSSTSTALTTGWAASQILGVPMGGGVEITRTVSGHGFSQQHTADAKASIISPSGSVSNATVPAWKEWDQLESSSSTSTTSETVSWSDWDTSTSASSSVATNPTSWYDWKPSNTLSSSPQSQTSGTWTDSNRLNLTRTSTINVVSQSASSWAAWDLPSSSLVSASGNSGSASSLAYLSSSVLPSSLAYLSGGSRDWSSTSAVPVLTVSTIPQPGSTTYQASSMAPGANGTSSGPWVARYTGAGSSISIHVAGFGCVMLVGMLAMFL